MFNVSSSMHRIYLWRGPMPADFEILRNREDRAGNLLHLIVKPTERR